MLLNYANLVGVNLDSSASYHVTKELPVSHPEHAFSHIEAQFVVPQYLKHLSQIQYVLFKLVSLDYHFVNIHFHYFTDLQPKHLCNHSLVNCPGIL